MILREIWRCACCGEFFIAEAMLERRELFKTTVHAGSKQPLIEYCSLENNRVWDPKNWNRVLGQSRTKVTYLDPPATNYSALSTHH